MKATIPVRSRMSRVPASALLAMVMTTMCILSTSSLAAPPASGAQAETFETPETIEAIETGETLAREGAPQPASTVQLAIWRRWRDPALRTLLDNAGRNAPTLVAAEARLRETRALLGQTAAERRPAIDLGGGAQRNRFDDRERLQDPENRRYAGQYDLSLRWRWDIDLFGAAAARTDAARWRAEAEAVARDAARSELAAEVARQYVLLRGGDAQQRHERALLGLLQEQQTIDDALVAAGLLAEYELRALRAEREARDAGLRDGEAGRRRAMLALRALGAGELDAIERAFANSASEDSDAYAQCMAPAVEPLPVSVLARRFDVRIAEHALRAASAEARAAQRARWPQLTLSGRGGWVGGDVDGLIRPSNLGAQLLAGLALPLLDFGRLKAQAQAAGARDDAARAELARIVLRAAEDVDAALLARERAQYAAERTASAQRGDAAALAVVRARWRAGLESRRQLIQNERGTQERAIAAAAAAQQLCEAQVWLSLALALPETPDRIAAEHSPESEADIASTGSIP